MIFKKLILQTPPSPTMCASSSVSCLLTSLHVIGSTLEVKFHFLGYPTWPTCGYVSAQNKEGAVFFSQIYGRIKFSFNYNIPT